MLPGALSPLGVGVPMLSEALSPMAHLRSGNGSLLRLVVLGQSEVWAMSPQSGGGGRGPCGLPFG